MRTICFPIRLLEEAFGNCVVKLEKCDNDPRLSKRDYDKLHKKPESISEIQVKKENLDDEFLNFLDCGNVTKISIRNCPYSNFNVVMVHDKDKIGIEGWAMGPSLPVYFTNFQKVVKVSGDKSISSKDDSKSPEFNNFNNNHQKSSAISTGVNQASGKRKFKCPDCGFLFAKKYGVTRHQMRKSCPGKGARASTEKLSKSKELKPPPPPDLGPDSAHVVDMPTLTPNNYNIVKGRYQCKVCKYVFHTLINLQSHQMTACGLKPMANGKLKCERCDKTYTNRQYLMNHVQRVHLNVMLHKCPFCPKRFSRARSLKFHMPVHTGERAYRCHQCGMSFKRPNSLHRHKRTHTGIKPSVCSLCLQRFRDPSTLRKHQQRKHPNQKAAPSSAALVMKPTSSNNTEVNIDTDTHMILTDSSDRPFQCKICKLGFTQKYTFSEHLKIHTGVRPFKCKICGYKFSRKKYLTNHMLTHSDEKTSKCPYCNCSYKRRDTLNRHISIRHPNKKKQSDQTETVKVEIV